MDLWYKARVEVHIYILAKILHLINSFFSLLQNRELCSISSSSSPPPLYIKPFPETLGATSRAMTGALFRNAASDAARILRSHRTSTANSLGKLDLLPRGGDVRRFQPRPYFRTPQLLGRSKEARVPPRSLISCFCSSSSSSTASTASFVKTGFMGWYMSMLKTRPVLTKSVTSSLIYIAADLSSQVSLVSYVSLCLYCCCDSWLIE